MPSSSSVVMLKPGNMVASAPRPLLKSLKAGAPSKMSLPVPPSSSWFLAPPSGRSLNWMQNSTLLMRTWSRSDMTLVSCSRTQKSLAVERRGKRRTGWVRREALERRLFDHCQYLAVQRQRNRGNERDSKYDLLVPGIEADNHAPYRDQCND